MNKNELTIINISAHCDPQASMEEPDAGGQCVYQHSLALELSKYSGIKVKTYCRQTGKRPDVTQVNDNYSIHRVQCGPSGFIPKEDIEPFLPEFVHKIKAELPQHKVVLYAHYWEGGKSALLLKAATSRPLPLVFTPHSLGSLKRDNFRGKENEMMYHFIPRLTWENYTLHISDHIIVSSENERNTLKDDYAVDPEKVSIISPGLSLDSLKPISQPQARLDLGIVSNGKVILCLGRMVATKGFHLALKAFAHLKQDYVEPLTLAIVGGSEKATPESKSYFKRLQSLAKRMNLTSHVQFLPAVKKKDVNVAYSASDIFWLPSLREPFGLTGLEAMAMYRPVVANNSDGPKAYIQSGYSGLLASIKRPEKFANATTKLLQDTNLYRRIQKNAHSHVEESYSWETIAPQFLDILIETSQIKHQHLADWKKKDYFLKTYL